MNTEDRIRFLLKVANRAEGEGNQHAARVYRRMADEARPLGSHSVAPESSPVGSGIE